MCQMYSGYSGSCAVRIWKSPIRPHAKHGKTWRVEIPAPRGSRVVSAAMQNGQPTVWFEVDPNELDDVLIVYAVGTGCGDVPPGTRFIATFTENSLVWHIYAEK